MEWISCILKNWIFDNAIGYSLYRKYLFSRTEYLVNKNDGCSYIILYHFFSDFQINWTHKNTNTHPLLYNLFKVLIMTMKPHNWKVKYISKTWMPHRQIQKYVFPFLCTIFCLFTYIHENDTKDETKCM